MTTCLLVHPGAELFGADRMLLESAVGLRQSGVTCVVALPEEGPLSAALAAEGIETLTVPMLVLRKALMRPRNWLRLLRSAAGGLLAAWKLVSWKRPDCIYVSTVTLPQWPLVGALRRVPVITHIHEAEGEVSRWLNMAIYLPHLASTTIVVNSRFTLEIVERTIPLLAKRAKVVENGVAGPPMKPKAPRDSLDGVLRVLYLGRLSPRKGPDLIVEAAKNLRDGGLDVRIVLAGSTFAGYEWYEAELRSSLRSAGFAEDQVLVGFKKSIWPLLEDCDVLVVPSRLDESFGNTVVEGVLAHRPVVVSDPSGLREAARGYRTAQVIPKNDSDELGRALERIVADWDMVSSLVETSARLAWERHDPAIYRRRISEVVAHEISPQPSAKP